MAGLLVMVATACLVQALRTRQQVLKYAPPPPVAERAEVPAAAPVPVHYPFVEDDFVEPFDPRPATAQLADRVQAIKDCIARLDAAGQAKQAVEMQSQLDAILARREGPYQFDGVRQLHAIGVYHRGAPEARVKITYDRAPLVLVFCAYFPVEWIVEVGPGVQIEEVILGGYHTQQIKGLPDGVAVAGQVNDNADRAYQFYAATALEGVPVADRLQELTGLQPTTFQISRRFGGSPVTIGPGGDEWTAAMTVSALEALHRDATQEVRTTLAKELVRHTFTDVICAPGGRYHTGQSILADQSIFGPYAESMEPLDSGTAQLAIDPRGPTLYGFQRNQGIIVIDPRTGATSPWPVESVQFRSHCDAYLTFDTRRNRLVAWDWDLLAIDPDTRKVDVVRKGKTNSFIRGLVYSPDDDLLYALRASSERESACNQVSIVELCTLNDRGEELNQTKLSLPIPGGDWNDTSPAVKLRIVGGKLLVIALGSSACSEYVSSTTNYIFDRHTGKLLFACRRMPR